MGGWVGALDADGQGAGMEAVASSGAPAIGSDRSGAGPLVIVVADPCQLRATAGAATAQLAAQVTVGGDNGGARGHRAPSAAKRPLQGLGALIDRAATMVVVVVVGSRSGVVRVGGPWGTWRVVPEPALVAEDRRLSLAQGAVAQLGELGSAGHRGELEAGVLTQAAGRHFETGRNLFRREGEYWTVCFEGAVVHLKDAKGLRHLARLLADPGREFHAIDLEAADGPPAPAARLRARAGAGQPGLAVRRDLGDAGALLDATAKAAYQARLTELGAELEEAEGCNDPARATKARQEMEFLVAELARAVGLGGRDRRAASHAERARLNATRAIRAAMANLARADPALGQHLAATVRTGRYCSYTPDPRVPIAWER